MLLGFGYQGDTFWDDLNRHVCGQCGKKLSSSSFFFCMKIVQAVVVITELVETFPAANENGGYTLIKLLVGLNQYFWN